MKNKDRAQCGMLSLVIEIIFPFEPNALFVSLPNHSCKIAVIEVYWAVNRSLVFLYEEILRTFSCRVLIVNLHLSHLPLPEESVLK